jgi:hypothetical protein
MSRLEKHYTCQFPGCGNRCARRHKVATVPVADITNCYLSLLYSHHSYFICENCDRDDDYHYYICRRCEHVYCHDCCFK